MTIVDADTAPATDAVPDGAVESVLDPSDPLVRLWGRLARPFEPVPTLAGLLGLPQPVVAQLVGTVLATSPEADTLLDEFPHTIRGLATSMETATDRAEDVANIIEGIILEHA